MSLRHEHQKETHFLKRRSCVDDFGWHVVLDQRYVKSLLDAMGMNHCESMATPGSKVQERHAATEKVGPEGISRVSIRCWDLSVHDRTTLRHCLKYERNDEGCSRTNHILKDEIEKIYTLPQKAVSDVYGTSLGLPSWKTSSM